jgi:hypothetical protein
VLRVAPEARVWLPLPLAGEGRVQWQGLTLVHFQPNQSRF